MHLRFALSLEMQNTIAHSCFSLIVLDTLVLISPVVLSLAVIDIQRVLILLRALILSHFFFHVALVALTNIFVIFFFVFLFQPFYDTRHLLFLFFLLDTFPFTIPFFS